MLVPSPHGVDRVGTGGGSGVSPGSPALAPVSGSAESDRGEQAHAGTATTPLRSAGRSKKPPVPMRPNPLELIAHSEYRLSMGRLENVSVEELQRALDQVEGSKPTQRLLAAIAYKHGVSQTELAEWHGVQRRTVYSWFRRLEAEPLPDAVADDPRPGRPRKLADSQLAALRETLHEPPTAAGYEETNWSPQLLQRHLREAFDVGYSVPSCRRLLNELGLEYRRPQSRAGTDADSAGASQGEKRGGRWVPR